MDANCDNFPVSLITSHKTLKFIMRKRYVRVDDHDEFPVFRVDDDDEFPVFLLVILPSCSKNERRIRAKFDKESV